MNKAFYFIVFLLLIPSAFATIEIEDIRGYVENEREHRIDKDGGEAFVNQKDIFDIVIELENKYNATGKAKLRGIIEDIDKGNGITKEQDWYDIAPGEKRSKTLSFSIPSEASSDNYDFDLFIYFRNPNGTETDTNIDYDIIVKSKSSDEEMDVDELISNLSSSCNALADSTQTCFGYIGRFDNCSDKLTTCNEEKGTFEGQSRECSSTLNLCQADKAEEKRLRTQCENEKNNMLTTQECNATINIRIGETETEKESEKNQMVGLMILLAVGGYYFLNKKDKDSVEGQFEYDQDIS